MDLADILALGMSALAIVASVVTHFRNKTFKENQERNQKIWSQLLQEMDTKK